MIRKVFMGPRSKLLKLPNQTKLVVNGAKPKKVKMCTQFVTVIMLKNSMPGSVVSLAIVIDEASPYYQPFQQNTS